MGKVVKLPSLRYLAGQVPARTLFRLTPEAKTKIVGGVLYAVRGMQ